MIADVWVLTPEQVEDVYHAMRKSYSGRTRLHVHRVLHIMFGYARRTLRIVTENVVDSVDAPKAESRENGVMSNE